MAVSSSTDSVIVLALLNGAESLAASLVDFVLWRNRGTACMVEFYGIKSKLLL